MRRKIHITLIIVFGVALAGNAQVFELIPYTGYQWGGNIGLNNVSVNEGEGDVSFINGQNVGVALGFNVLENSAVQAEYFRKTTNMDLTVYGQTGGHYQRFKAFEQWFQVGFIQQFPMQKFIPYTGISAGIVGLSQEPNGIDKKLVFGMTGQIGIKYFFTNNLGLRLYSRMLVPFNWDNFVFHFESRDDIKAEVSSGSKNLQGDIGLGLVLQFN